MDTEFHYYITGIIAHAAGFSQKEASLIAWSSEFTDENDVVIKVQDRSTDKIYENYISQTMNILKPKRKLMRIYPIFHFVPGQPDDPNARRSDGKMHILNTIPDGGIAGELLDESLKKTTENRLHSIGIATHAYADTWAHQNFVGWYDYFNNIALDPKPDIGHADAEHHPDWVAHRWDDERLVNTDINNSQRFMGAAEGIYKRFRNHLKTKRKKANKPIGQLKSDLEKAMGNYTYSGSQKQNEKKRFSAYKELAPWLKHFEKDKWQEEVMEGSLFELCYDGCWYAWKEEIDFEKTNWFYFMEAVKEHQATALKYLEPIFIQMGVDLRKY